MRLPSQHFPTFPQNVLKKLMIAAAAALCGSVFADTAIQSANVVGYSNDGFAANKNVIIGAQFEGIGSEEGFVSFDDLLKPTAVGAWGDGEDDDMGNAPMLMVLTGSIYNYYYYISDATYDEDQDYEPVGHDCWADRDGIILKDSAIQSIGSGFWIRMQDDKASGDMIFNGQVNSGNSFSIPVVANKNKIIANPYPMALDYAKLTVGNGLVPGAWGDGEDDDMGNAPMLMVLTGSIYNYYYYIADATYDEDQDYEPVGYDCWADRDGIILTADKQIPVNGGFWVRTTTSGDVTFSK